MIYRKDVLELISNGESDIVEFKRQGTTPEKLSKEICAFANTKGGYLIIGVDDDKTIVGVKSEKSELYILEQACIFNIEPVPEYELSVIPIKKNVDIVVAYIPQSLKKPHKIKLFDAEKNKFYWRAYIRNNDESVIASREMTNLMAYISKDEPMLNINIGKIERILFEHLETNKRTSVKEFASYANISRRRAERILIQLVKLGVIMIHTDSQNDFFTAV